MIADGLVPGIVTLPMTAALMVIVAAHLMATAQVVQPSSRRRIRVANGVVMLITLPLLAAGFSVLDPDTQRGEWILVWLGASGLLGLSILLALTDMANTMRLAIRARRRLRASLRDIARQNAVLRRAAARSAANLGGADRER